MSKSIWRDCKKQQPLVDDGELVLMDSNDIFWVGFCKITSDGVFYFANNAEPLKNDFVKYARIEKLLALETELECTRKALDVAVDALKEYADRDNWGMGFAPWLEDGFKDALYTEDGYKTAEKALEQITALEQKD